MSTVVGSRDTALAEWLRWAASVQHRNAALPAPDGAVPVERARAHRVEPLLYAALADADDPRRGPLASAARATAGANLLLAGALPEVLDAFERAGIRYALFKGAAIVVAHPERRGTRTVSDADILVSPRDFRAARRALVDAGFGADDPPLPLSMAWNNERGFRREAAPTLHIDLHRGLHRPPLFAHLGALALRGAVRRGGVWVVSDAHAPLVIAAHRAKHGYSNDARELYDYFTLVDGAEADTLARLRSDAATTGVSGALYVVWALTRAWFGPMGEAAERAFAQLAADLAPWTEALDAIAVLDSLGDADKPWARLPFLKMYLPMPLLTDRTFAPIAMGGVHAVLRAADAALERIRR